MWVFAKATHIFFSKKKQKNCELDIVLTRTANILTINELVKLTMLWTTGPRSYQASSEKESILKGNNLLPFDLKEQILSV